MLQLAASCPNFLIQEAIGKMDSFGGFDKIMDDPFVFDKGYFIPSDKPGLGIEINEEKVKNFVVNAYDEKNILI